MNFNLNIFKFLITKLIKFFLFTLILKYIIILYDSYINLIILYSLKIDTEF